MSKKTPGKQPACGEQPAGSPPTTQEPEGRRGPEVAGNKRRAGQQASPRRRRPAGQPEQPADRKRPRPSSNQPEAEGAQVQQQQQQNICAGCLRPIKERYLLVALDKQWHEDCLKCACCDCRLGEVGSSLFTHSGKILCRRDFQRIFGQHGHCAVCKKSIPPYEMVMRANENAYHMDCFACQQCQYRFCVGDRFHLTDKHKIICILCHSDAALLAPSSASASGQPQNQLKVAELEENSSSAAASPTASLGPDSSSSAAEPASFSAAVELAGGGTGAKQQVCST